MLAEIYQSDLFLEPELPELAANFVCGKHSADGFFTVLGRPAFSLTKVSLTVIDCIESTFRVLCNWIVGGFG
jgi:hypothetical protein